MFCYYVVLFPDSSLLGYYDPSRYPALDSLSVTRFLPIRRTTIFSYITLTSGLSRVALPNVSRCRTPFVSFVPSGLS